MYEHPIAILNELSLPSVTDEWNPESITSILDTARKTLQSMARLRPDIGLVSSVGIGSHIVSASGNTLSSLATSTGKGRESWRYIRSRQNRAPHREPYLDSLEEFSHAGTECVGLAHALRSQQVAFSFDCDDRWRKAEISLERTVLEEIEGQVAAVTSEHMVSHTSLPEHVRELTPRLRRLGLTEAFTDKDLWLSRTSRFPHVEFLSRVETQLERVYAEGVLVSVDERLEEIEAAVAEWDGSGSAVPLWRSAVTPESDSRRGLTMFVDEDDVVRAFELHARYTPGPGRIHFRLVVERDKRRVRIGYIGRKLM